MTSALVAAVVGALVAFIVGWRAMEIGTALRLLDHPDPDGGRKLHAKVTPLVGGVAVLVAAIFSVLLILPGAEAGHRATLLWFLFTVCGLFLVGAMDDRVELAAPTRLAVASAFLLSAIAQVPDFSVAFLLFTGQDELVLFSPAVGIGFTLLCFVGLLNAVNMADGKNGIVIGQAIIWSMILMLRLPPEMLPLVSGIAGALSVLFVFNMQGKLFLGDGGSYGLSAMFGLLAIYAWNQGFADMRADDVALIFAIPVFDTLRLIVWRTAQGKSPFTPGRDHLHHYLHARWGWPRPLALLLVLVAVPNALAVLFPGTALLWLVFTFAAYFALIWFATVEPRRRPA